MKKFTLLILALLFTTLLILMTGCNKRTNPTLPDSYASGMMFVADHQYDGISDLSEVSWAQFKSRKIIVYTPPGYSTVSGPRYPVLYLLPGHDGEPEFSFVNGNENYYTIANINLVADKLIAEGEIKPLIICMPDASIWYGGSFYANSDLAGDWEDMMASELLNYMDNTQFERFRTLNRKESRAISGHAAGGYGAMRIGMKFPDNFNSISAIDAPLAFSGDANYKGLQPHFQQYLSENNINSESDFFNTDSTNMRNERSKLLLYSMAATFSAVDKDVTTKFGNMLISLPFDYQGNTVQTVWDKWLANDVYSWLDNTDYQEVLNNQHLYFETSDSDPLYFNEQTLAFQDKLKSLGIDFKAATFSAYEGNNPGSRAYLNERLVEILKYHDRYLKDRNDKF